MENNNEIICYHCGDVCKDDSISKDGKYFCCTGCLYVHELLSDNNLNDFYSLSKSAGIKPKKIEKDEFAYLDNHEIKEKLLQYSINGTAKVTLFIPEVYCSACIWLLENLYRLNKGILESKVNFLKKEISIVFRENVTTLREIVELLTSIGYRPKLNIADIEGIKQKNPNKPLYIKLGISGFVFGNIMLLALPEYFSGGNLEETIQIFIRYLTLGLGTLVLYAASDYFQSAWTSLKLRHVNIDVPISIGIIVLYLRSFYDIVTMSGPGFIDSLSGLVFFLLIGKLFRQKTFYSLSFDRDFKSFFPLSIMKKDAEQNKFIPLKDIKIGDRLIVRSNEIIPADSILLSDSAIIDYSFVTGEAKPVTVQKGEKIFAGGKHLGPSIEIEAIKEFYQSYLTELWNHKTFKEEKLDKGYSVISDTAAKYFTFIVLAIAIITFLYWLPKDINLAWDTFTAVLIIACPCALALTIPFTYGTTLREFSKRNFYLKNDVLVEKIAKIDTIVFDKTGTLTDIKGSKLQYKGKELSDKEKVLIKSTANNSIHPLSFLIVKYFENFETLEVKNYLEEIGKGLEASIDGVKVKIGSYNWVNDILAEKMFDEEIDKTAESKIFINIDNKILGYFQVLPHYRENLQDFFQELKKNYNIYIISGDNNSEESILREITGDSAELHFNMLPDDKLKFIEALQEKGHNVMMVGDGLNDAGALKQSDLGVAIAESNSSFTPGSDAILMSDKFSELLSILKLSKKGINTVFWSFGISFAYNIIGMFLAVQGILSPLIAAVFMPISSINVVFYTVSKTKLHSKLLLTKKI